MSELNKGKLKFDVDIPRLQQTGIFVMTPMYGGLNYGGYSKSLMSLAVMCNQFGIPFHVYFMYNESLIPRARNMCSDAFIRSEQNIGVFIDADIEFTPQDVLIMSDIMLKNGYDVFCGAYPKKNISWEKIVDAVNAGAGDDNPENLENFVGDYVVNWLHEGKVDLLKPVEIAEGGTGFMFFHKDTLIKYRDAFPDQSYIPDHPRTKDFDGSREIHAFFDCIIDPDTRRYLSEDYFFCRRVRQAGMKVWLAPWVSLKHTGTYTFGGSLIALSTINANATADPKRLKKK
jgi:hypothetical protein